jgi:hypothetical protein
MNHPPKTYSVYSTNDEGGPGRLEEVYDTVAEVLAPCEEQDKPYSIRVGNKFLSLDEFMASHVAAG